MICVSFGKANSEGLVWVNELNAPPTPHWSILFIIILTVPPVPTSFLLLLRMVRSPDLVLGFDPGIKRFAEDSTMYTDSSEHLISSAVKTQIKRKLSAGMVAAHDILHYFVRDSDANVPPIMSLLRCNNRGSARAAQLLAKRASVQSTQRHQVYAGILP